ncbi:3-carboxymuconate cyclase [Ophiostoma piceae UAMH 11346]|uniref:3-carboxymuconate cyclase n=1 Tax=Ophiostoma piceae (strain UAMH 11346) TaxID=1262450 RepID=S3BZJ1_OPHP1|nr:3-carboxymuconate cyclase [Ophiostoma piceae UAMH 11346]
MLYLPHIVFGAAWLFAEASASVVHRPRSHLERSNSKAANTSGKAIYIITNDAQANSVVAIPIASDGSLLVDQGSSTATGAAGLSGLTADGAPAGPDSLFSQSAITLADHSAAGSFIFAVNPGNNSVSMLAIDAQDPAKLSLVGEPVVFPGQFPNTVAASPKNNMVCVGMTGAESGVSCATYSLTQGIQANTVDALRPLALTPAQTTPPVGPVNTVSQVFFSEDQRTLYATVKGDGNSTTGFLASYPVMSAKSACGASARSVAAAGTTSSPNGTAVLFGAAPIKVAGRAKKSADMLFVTDASFGAAVLSVDKKTGVASTVGRGVVSGQKATCWAVISPATNTAFVTDVASDRLVEMSLTDASIIGAGPIELSNGDPGLIDLRAAGQFLYALSPGNGTGEAAVTVVDAVKRQQVQHASLASLGLAASAQGMAILA